MSRAGSGALLWAVGLVVWLAWVIPAQGFVSPHEQLPDPAQEARARELGRELRCLVCQNQSIEESDAPLARDLRRFVREQIRTGRDDVQIREALIQRFGSFVLLRPPVDAGTGILWATPLLAVLMGVWVVWRRFRRRQG